MAWVMAARITGSPERASRRFITCVQSTRLSGSSPTSRPVSIKAQVEALTNSDSLRPTCASQSAPPILSRIRRSAVAASGMRSSASARHISTMPSRELSAYSCRNASRPPGLGRARTECTRRRAARSMRASASGENRAFSMSAAAVLASSARWSVRTAARSRSGGGGGSAKIMGPV